MNHRLLKKGLAITSVIILPALLIYVLYSFSYQPNKENNGFIRHFSTIQAIPTDTLLADNIYGQICGITNHHIFLEESKDKRNISMTDWSLKKMTHLQFRLPNKDKILSRVDYQIDSPIVSISAGNGPTVFKANLNDTAILLAHAYPISIFLRSYALPNDRYFMRSFDTGQTAINFYLWNADKNMILSKTDPFLSEAKDMGIGNDGLMDYDTSTHILVYVQFYKNGITTMDDTLGLIGRVRTIDTTIYGKTTGGGYNEGGKEMFMTNTPQFVVNAAICTERGKLYITSKLRGDNENRDSFKEYSAIDVYDILAKKYLYSFQIPKLFNKSFYSFKIHGSRAVATYPGGIVTYTINHI